MLLVNRNSLFIDQHSSRGKQEKTFVFRHTPFATLIKRSIYKYWHIAQNIPSHDALSHIGLRRTKNRDLVIRSDFY